MRKKQLQSARILDIIRRENRLAISLFALFSLSLLTIRLYLRGSFLEMDEAEQLIYGQTLSFGYHNQLPLYTWLQYLFFHIFGMHLASLALLKSFLIFLCLYYYYRICLYYCSTTSLAFCATLAWVCIPSISLDLIKDNTHSILALLAACMTWHYGIAFRHQQSGIYVAIRWGAVIALGLLSKFNYLLFLISYLLSAPSPWFFKKNKFALLSFGLALGAILPYLYWLHLHPSGLQAAYKLTPQNKSAMRGFFELMKTISLFSLPALLFIYCFFPLSLKKIVSNNVPLKYYSYSVAVLSIVVLLLRYHDFETRWLIPIHFISPLIIFASLKPEDISYKIRIPAFVSACILIEMLLLTSIVYRARVIHNYQQTMLTPVLKQIQKSRPDLLVSESYWLLGNLYSALPYKFLLLDDAHNFHKIKGHILLVWKGKETPLWAALLTKNNQQSLHFLHDDKGRICGGWADLQVASNLLPSPCVAF